MGTMAVNKSKSDSKRGDRNTSRRNSKAWKRRACGERHEPRGCVKCDAASLPTPLQEIRAEQRRINREDAKRAANRRATERIREPNTNTLIA